MSRVEGAWRILAGVAIALGASAAQAQFYAGVDAGMSWPRDMEFDFPTTPNPIHPTEFDSGSVFAVRAGWRFGQVRLEAEGAWRRNDVDTFGAEGDVGRGTGEMDADSWMVNALYDFRFGSKFVPYLGLGLGTVKVKATTIRKDISAPDCCTGILEGSDRAFGLQGIAGIAYEATANWAVTFDYRYLATGDVRFDYRAGCTPDGALCTRLPGTTEDKYRAHALSLGLRYVF